MLFRDTVVVYCENHITSTLCGKNADVFNITVGTTRPYGHRFVLNTTLNIVHTIQGQG